MKTKPVNKTPRIPNPFEQSLEFAQDTAKKVGQELVDTFNPMSGMFENPTRKEHANGEYTQVDFEKLNESYGKQDTPELAKIREQLNPEAAKQQQEKQQEYDYHKRVKREEEEYLLTQQKEEEEEKRQEAYEEQQQKQLEEEERIKQQQAGTPKGKVRRTILGGRGKQKSSTELPPELKPGVGKQ